MNALGFGVLCFSSLLTIIDPLAAAPMFVAVTRNADSSKRRRVAIKACFVALGILFVFALAGGLIFRLFGITINAFRIAGGILFFAMAMPMLLGGKHDSTATDASLTEADPSIVPLGMPIICGPGAISTVMVLMGQSESTAHAIFLLIALICVIAATALVLIVSPLALRFLGRAGVEVITKVMGLLVCVIGVQFIIDGMRPIVLDLILAGRG